VGILKAKMMDVRRNGMGGERYSKRCVVDLIVIMGKQQIFFGKFIQFIWVY
jgi:hypothetical protein